MPNSELYFIIGMFILILAGSFLSVYLFVRQYNREKRDKAIAQAQKKQQAQASRTAEK
jgi:uncharacterized protein YpmB